jgi:lipopolysaccharide/colanic/teichoic acid biosynthesis glycosyltransferase
MIRGRDILVCLWVSPVIIIAVVGVAVWIRASDGPSVLFRQLRPGREGKSFELLKFRTMTSATTMDGKPLPDAQRLTPLGRFLRSTSLDELPSLWNVLKGDMSLVGPRPLLPEYLPLYSERQRRRHEVRPGITGWAQVNGRNQVGWAERLEMDVWYVENQSFWLDMKILWMTIWKVLKREGINQEGSATMEPFRGER